MPRSALILFVLVAASVGLTAPAQTPPDKPAASAPAVEAGIPPELAVNIRAAISNGLDWLADQQKEDGSWSNAAFPALTAMPLQAFLGGRHPKGKAIGDKAVAFILTMAQEDGGIYRKSLIPGRGGLGNYNTSICMTALHATGDRAHTKVIQNARTYVANSQLTGQDVNSGGFGYSPAGLWRSTDLMNTTHALEAMRVTQDVEDLRGQGKRVDVNWEKAVKYIEQLQNKPEAGDSDAGGFFYKPGKSMAGTTNSPTGAVVFRSYGSMTYVGLLALIHSNVPRDDPRVLSAFDWACKHWSLDENPGLGKEGMYFFYHVLTKSLSTFGRDLVPLKDGSRLNWRVEVAKRILALQKTDPATGRKFWANETGRYWESDPVLVTSYMVQALEWILPPEPAAEKAAPPQMAK